MAFIMIKNIKEYSDGSFQFLSEESIITKIPIENILDIGCHQGGTILGYKNMCHPKKIYGFEGSIENYTIAKNALNFSDVELFNVAVSNFDEEKGTFYLSQDSVSSSLSYPTTKVQLKSQQPIKVIRIDTWAKQNNVKNVDFVKIDVQGDDFKVIVGIGNFIKLVKILKVEVWFGGAEEYYKNVDLFDTVLNYLNKNGMIFYSFPMLFYNNSGKLLWGDAIFLRKDLI
jgi:hypothetical protein